jgi:hypothetical protein
VPAEAGPRTESHERHSRNESRQEVTTVKLMTINRRPSTLLAVCAPVSGVPGSLAASAAHALVGHTAVGGEGIGTLRIQAQRAQIEGRNASAAYGLKDKDSVGVAKTFGDVRGIPPRGRPV